jgi:hypothetical protein
MLNQLQEDTKLSEGFILNYEANIKLFRHVLGINVWAGAKKTLISRWTLDLTDLV